MGRERNDICLVPVELNSAHTRTCCGFFAMNTEGNNLSHSSCFPSLDRVHVPRNIKVLFFGVLTMFMGETAQLQFSHRT